MPPQRTRPDCKNVFSPIPVSITTIKTLGVAPGYNSSAVVTGQYTIAPTSSPTFSPAPGTYSSAQNVSLAGKTSGAVIYYTTNGTAPTTASPVYQGPILVSVSTTIKAIDAAPGFNNSSVSSGAYSITLP